MTNLPDTQKPSSACCSVVPAITASGEVTLGFLLMQLEAARGRDLVFIYDGHPTKPGYHVTEIKSARVTGLDCGANAESWSEVVIQLWDIEDSVTGERMTVDKLLGISRKVLAQIAAEDSARLTFEVSDGTDAMRIFSFEHLDVGPGVASVVLTPRASACKPLVRGTLSVAPGKGCGSEPAILAAPPKSQCCG